MLESRRVEQVFGPASNRSPKPGAEWNAEAHLWPVEQLCGHVASEDLTEDPLLLAAAYLHAQRKPESELDEQLRQAHAESEALEAELVKALGDAEDKLQRAREVYRRGTAHVEKKPRALGEE